MPWVVKGKIAGHFPARSNPNLDVAAIGFIPAGNNQTASDIKNIKAVYFIPAGTDPSSVTTSNLHNYLVWERYWEEPSQRLLAEATDHYVLMKYSPTTDKTVSTVGILTKGTSDNGRCVYILDENGILIGKSSGQQAVDLDITVHGYTANRRTTTFSTPVTLKAGKDYWIQYYFENCQNSPDAYYLNEQGTEYKNLALNNYSQATPVDMSTMNYVGSLFQSNTQMADIMVGVLQLNENDVFKPNRSSEYPIQGMTINNFYERGNLYLNRTIKQVDHSSLPSDKDKPRNSELATMSEGQLLVIGYDNGSNGMVYVYERSAISIPTEITEYSQVQSNSSIANWMVEMNVTNKACTFSSGNWNWPYTSPSTDGSIYKRTSNGSLKFSSANDKITSVPSSPVVGDIYYKDSNLALPGVTQYRGDLMVFYDGNQYQELLEIDKEYTLADQTKIKFFEKINSSDLATNITSTIWPNNSLRLISALNPQPTIVDISTQSEYMKHYLEINGDEVT